MTCRLIRLPEVIEMTGYARSTIYAMMRAGDFPDNRRLGARAVAWVESEITEWIESRDFAYKTALPPLHLSWAKKLK